MLPELLRIEQLSCEDGLLLILIRIERRDALLGGAVLLVRETGLFQRIQLPVPGQQQRGSVADLQIFRRDGYALGHHILHLIPEVLAVQRHAVAQNVDHALAENAGGQQVQGKFSQVVHHGVAGVAAALIAHHHIVVTGQQIHHAALALVAPVDAYDGTI